MSRNELLSDFDTKWPLQYFNNFCHLSRYVVYSYYFRFNDTSLVATSVEDSKRAINTHRAPYCSGYAHVRFVFAVWNRTYFGIRNPKYVLYNHNISFSTYHARKLIILIVDYQVVLRCNDRNHS